MAELIDGLPFIEHDGEPRKLAWLFEEDEQLLKALPPLSAAGLPRLDRKDIEERDLFIHSELKVKNQGRFGSCTNQAYTTAYLLRWLVMGRPYVPLSSTFAYAHINGGRDVGASMSAVLRAGLEIGLSLESQCPQNCIYTNQVPNYQEARKTALKYRLHPQGFFRCESYLDLLTAITLGFPAGFGILVGENFGNLDRDGICPVPDRVVGGHALCGARNRKSQREGMVIDFPNSWDVTWGKQGWGTVSEKHFERRIDAWALILPNDNEDNPDGLPRAK